MSVAFRRESDDEHKEPEYRAAHSGRPDLVTPRGLRLLGEEVVAARSRRFAGTDRSRKRARNCSAGCVISTPANRRRDVQAPPANGSVGIGNRVRYRLNRAEKAITIVGGDEADPALGSIAFFAPLARALMGAEAGEAVEYQDRDDAITILAVETDPETQA